MTLFGRLIPWRRDADADERFMADLVAGVSLIFIPASAFYFFQSLFLNAGLALPAVCAVGTIAFSANLFALRRRSWSRATRVGLTAELVVLVSAGAALGAGFRTFNSGWELCVPLLAVFLLGMRSGVVVALLLAVEGVAFWWAERAGLYVPPHSDLEVHSAMAIASPIAMLILVVGIGYVYERVHGIRRALLSKTIQKLEATHRELVAAQEKLIAGEKMTSLGLLAAGVAHEINNPMSYVTCNLEALVVDLPDLRTDDVLFREYANQVIPATLEGAQRVNAIVADLRRFARGDPERFVEYDLNNEISTALRMAHSELQRRETRLDLALGPLPRVLGLPRQVMQVVMNLVVNAAQASDVGALVRVTSAAAAGEVRFTVQDSGMGMSADTMGHLFEPFFTTKPVGEGTGLGLSVAHGIVAAHGGRIEVDSSPGKGSAFTVVLPVVPTVRLNARESNLTLS